MCTVTLDPVQHPIDETDDRVVSPAFYLSRRTAIGAMQQLTGLIQPVADKVCFSLRIAINSDCQKITTDSIACLQTAAIAALSRSEVFVILADKEIDIKKGLHADEIMKRMPEEKRFSVKNLP